MKFNAMNPTVMRFYYITSCDVTSQKNTKCSFQVIIAWIVIAKSFMEHRKTLIVKHPVKHFTSTEASAAQQLSYNLRFCSKIEALNHIG